MAAVEWGGFMSQPPSRAYGQWLWVLLAAFGVRVVAQPLAWWTRSPILPPFESWQSGILPYWLLFVAQVLIVIALSVNARRFSRGVVEPRISVGAVLLTVGVIYFGTMAVRLVLGATVFVGHPWLDRPIPTFFHLILAACIVLCGMFHVRHGGRIGRGTLS